MSLRDLVRRLILGPKSDSMSYLRFLRKKGMLIGEGTEIFAGPSHVTIDEQNPHLLTIGRHVQIAGGVAILTHDYSWSVLKGKFGAVLGSQGCVSIGDNVFIGLNAVILPGTTIGSNVVVGANSTVKGVFPENCVIAGSPARIVCDLDAFYEKRRERQLPEAIDVYSAFLRREGRAPSQELFREYFWLFEGGEVAKGSAFDEVNRLVDQELTARKFSSWIPQFPGFDAFSEYCLMVLSDENQGQDQ